MTNSIASAKCPSVLTSGKYGMSQQRSIIDDSKEYIFVKLTDSAFRAIEEYQRNAQSKRLQKGQCAKIQFIGNAGVIHFPPAAADGSFANIPADGRKFGFAIDDVEGSLECIQQSGADLDVLGSLNYRMRIHANDDVYDTTRTKMAIAEETEKSKCIREIKPNQTDIGRKVKRPVSAASIQAYTNGMTSSLNVISNGGSINSNSSSINGSSSYLSNSSNNNHSSSNSNSNSRNKLSALTLNQHSPPSGNGSNGASINGSRMLSSTSLRSSPNPSLMGSSGTVGSSGNINNRYGSPSNQSSSNLPSISMNGVNSTDGYSPPGLGLNSNNHMPTQQKKGTAINGANNRGNGTLTSAGKGSLGGGKSNNVKSLDVSRRKIRERLIHLLALKPFKKPELYTRLQNEGLAQRERQLISTILKDISTLSRDNTYNLRRSMWNDVDENWPFFSEQEIQQLKRRKPQNLTPPMSSDAGSSTSGQSPTSSTHTGSPPPLSSTGSMINGGVGGLKRTSLESDMYDGTLSLGIQSKKQRISHYKKDGSNNNNLTNSNNLGAGARLGMGINGGIGNGIVGGGASTFNQNQRSSSAAFSPHSGYNTSNNGNEENSDLTFNVLNNMDDFIQHTTAVGGDHNFTGRSKTASSNNNRIQNASVNGGSNSSVTPLTLKEKRNSAGSTSSSSGYSSNRESSSTSSSSMRRKNSPTPYTNNFVPETKTSSNSNGNNSSSRSKQTQQIQRHQQSSPNYNNNGSNNNHSHKSVTNHNNSSVIPNISEDYTTAPPTLASSHAPSNHNALTNRSRNHLSSSNGRNGEPSSNKRSRSSTPTQKHPSKHSKQNNYQHHQSQEEQRQQLALYGNEAQTPPQTASHSSSQQQQTQQQEHSSPTQQIAAAASTFSLTNHHSTSSGDAPRYDFSSYTPITSIEQRRRYKTEFESDYDEYRKLLAQIESVGDRFRELADRLNRVQQGCSDYYNIKDQIVSEYNRIRREEGINRDKQRFDYLHEKLAHIKQLVMDYDKKLTSGMAVPTADVNQQKQQHHSQQELQNQQNQAVSTVTNNSAHLSPMLQSSGESNHSPPSVVMNPTNTVLSKNSTSHARKGTKHHQKNHQHQEPNKQEQHYQQQHHEPETIHIDEETSLRYHSYNGNDNTGGNNLVRQHENQQFQMIPPASFTSSSTAKRKLQQQNNEQQLQNNINSNNNNINNYSNNNDSGSDSDSSSSSSSNDDDNSDDDISDASDDDDDNTDDDSNDDDNNDQ